MERVVVAPMSMEHYGSVRKLWEKEEKLNLRDVDSSDSIQTFLSKNSATCFIALEKDQVVGAVLAGSDGRRGYIYHLVVDRHVRKCGVGKLLCDTAVSALAEAGIKKVYAYAFKNNLSALKFWRAAGWSERDDMQLYSIVSGNSENA